MPAPYLTIGMLTHEDFHGVYFTLQSIVIYHREILDRLAFVVIDNSPDSPQGKETAAYCAKIPRCHYSAVRGAKSTSLRNLVFELAPTDKVLCMDSHCFLHPNAIKRLIKFYELNPTTNDLYQGPMMDEANNVIATQMHPGFRDTNFGVWHTDPRANDEQGAPFEIPGHGMGLFSCTRPGWIRFAPGYREFGGEELLIHERFRLAGRKCWCLPFLRWTHRFSRPEGVSYPLNNRSKALNFMRGFRDIGLSLDPVVEYFARRLGGTYDQSLALANELRKEAESGPPCPFTIPEGYKHFLGLPIELCD